MTAEPATQAEDGSGAEPEPVAAAPKGRRARAAKEVSS
jgi:hypothetical protein